MEYKLKKFAIQMQHELDANAYKGNWQQFMNPEEIKNEITYHHIKLEQAINRNDSKCILEHTADCANLYLMLANAYKLI